MRAVIQRVSEARVRVEGSVLGEIGTGLLVLLGVAKPDTAAEAEFLAEKILNLRVFPDETGKMNRSLMDTGGALLVVSQFTLYADTRRGRRPSFDDAMPPREANEAYEAFLAAARAILPVQCGRFGASMQVLSQNDGPVTLVLDSKDP